MTPARSGPGRAVRLAAAAAAGLALTAAQPPAFLWPLVFLAWPGLAWLVARAPSGSVFWIGWAAGAAFFLSGLHWIAEAFLVDPERHAWMAPFAVVGMAAGLALFWGAAFWTARRLAGTGWGLAPALAGAVILAELARSYVLTGFPWALPAYVWAGAPVAQTAALVGPHGLGLATLALALAPAAALLATAGPRARAVGVAGAAAAVAAAVAGAWVWGASREARAPLAAADAPEIRLVQPNAAQRDKWRPEMIPVFFARARDLSLAEDGVPADLVLWPESASPYLLETDPAAREAIGAAGGGAVVLTGTNRVAPGPDGAPGWRNAMTAVDAEGAILASYDKRRLVPFGEYLPFHGLMVRLGLGPMVGQSGGFARGTGPLTLDLPGLPRLAPQICYETIFPHRFPPLSQRPAFIAQATNDAWFGASAGPWQHFHQARMRAIEQGLPVARAANTGISALIDAHGRVVTALPLGVAGAVQAPLPPPTPPTPYARTGDAPALAAALLALALGAWTGRARRRGA